MAEQNRKMPSQNISSNSSSGYREDEISLIDLWKIMTRHKALIFICIMICVIAGGLYTMLKLPVFEATTQIRIGQIDDIGPLEEGEVISAFLFSRYGKDLADGVERELPVLKKASVSKASTKILELIVEGGTPEESITLLKQITDEVIRRHHTIQQSNFTALKERIQKLKSQRELLQNELDSASEILKTLKHSHSVQATFVLLERSQITTVLNEIDQESFLLQQKLISPKTTPTETIGEIVAPVSPSAPKKTLIVVVSPVLGIMIGLMTAFVAEFISKARSV
jgi:uncharacterized protein involved in exopolysaccharide biosynthesis